MDVLRLHGIGDMRLHNESRPHPEAGEVCLRVTAVGICGSDLHWLEEAGIGDAQISRPLVLGHEFSAVVEDPTSALNGQRVTVDPAIPCQECEFCLDGKPNLCIQLHFAGHGRDDGALRQYMAWPERCLYPLPESISDEEGAMLEPLGVAMHAMDLGGIQPGDTVGVFGVGPIGLLVVQLARLAGVEQIIVTDRLPHRLEAAQSMGATQGFLVTDEFDEQEVWRAIGERGVDVAFEVAGENQAVETAITAAKAGGRVILVGIPAQDWTTFTASTARRKGLTIKLSRRMKFTYPRAIQLVEDGLIDVRSLITYCYPLAEYKQAFRVARRREGLKVIVKPSRRDIS
jgi:L-iditol 2-dehydrogenase